MLDKNKVEKFISEALKYKGDKYSQPKRLQPGYSDCSSLIQKAGANIGLWSISQTVTTKKMGVTGDSRFKQIPVKDLERGDILWYRNDKNGKYFGHVGIYLGDGKVLEAIYAGVGIYPKNRIAWQRVYRIVALESPPKREILDKKGITTAGVLNIRSGPDTNQKILGQLKKGTQVDLKAKIGDWYEIIYQGKKAFISASYVEIQSDKIENIPILINGKEIIKGYIIDGTTFITIGGKDKPVRKVFEGIGAKVLWKENKVQIEL